MIEQGSQPILVSGVHRSGTTWVGKMLAASSRVAYISEPLNVWHRPGVMRVPTEHWYTYICEDNQEEYLSAFQEMLSFKYHSFAEVQSIASGKDLLRFGRDWWIFWTGRIRSRLPLIKDPFAVFSSLWFNSCLGCRVVIVVRHPAAVTSSLVKLGWDFDIRDLLDQPLLMRDWLEPYRGELEQLLNSSGDLVARSCMLWRIVYQSVNKMVGQLPGLSVIRHEDLSLNPQAWFKQLYGDLGLEYTPAVQEKIKVASSGDNPKETSRSKVHSVRIDSRSVVKSWQRRLSAADIDRIKMLTSDVAPLYYTAEDWQ